MGTTGGTMSFKQSSADPWAFQSVDLTAGFRLSFTLLAGACFQEADYNYPELALP